MLKLKKKDARGIFVTVDFDLSAHDKNVYVFIRYLKNRIYLDPLNSIEKLKQWIILINPVTGTIVQRCLRCLRYNGEAFEHLLQ